MRLIDADEVIKKMNERAEEEILDFRDCRNMIEFAPTVNAIEIPNGVNGDDLELIHTNGLDMVIRCALCSNKMKSESGCDGGCVINKYDFENVMKAVGGCIEKRSDMNK